MTNTKARRERDLIDEVIGLKRDKAKQYGRARQDASVSSAQGVPLGGSGKKGSSDSNANNDTYLSTIGGTMMGPIAFYLASATIASGVIDISKESGNYSSRMLVIGEGASADDLEVILNASFAGQILFFQPFQAITLQSYLKTATAWASGTSYSVGDVVLYSSQRYTCYVAHTSSGSILPTDTTKWYRNNIRVTGATERIVAIDEIIMLQYDSTDSVWTVISGGGTGGSGVGLADNNIWTGTNTFQSTVSMTGSSITLGDAGTDIINMVGKLGTDLNMNDYDITTVDRLEFSATGTNNLAATDYGIATDSTDSDDLHYNVPSGRSHEFDVAGTQTLHISPTLVTSQVSLWVAGAITATGNVSFRGTTTIGNSTSDTVTFTAVAASSLDMATNDIERVGQIEFSSTSHYIKSNSVGFEYRVPVGDDHEFFVNGISEFKVEGGLCTVKNSLQVDDNVTLGATSADLTTHNGLVNYATNYSAVGLPAATSAGYITIQVGGVAKKLYYYS